MKNIDLKKWQGRTAYQLIPDRFYKGKGSTEKIGGRILKNWDDRTPNWKPDKKGEYLNNFYYGGNIEGIKSKLNYLKKLGFDMIYITPIEQSSSYHHYDVGNHSQIDPWLGNWTDFKNLCKASHELDILIMVDLVFNHTGFDSIYANDPKYHDWYKYDSNGDHVYWWGFKTLIECDTLNKSYQDAMTKIVEKYLENGADGIRLDLGENLSKEFLLSLQRVKEKYPNALFVGETWGFAIPDNQKDESKILDGELDSVMNYPMSDAILRWVRYGDYIHFKYNFDKVYNSYPSNVQNVLLNNIGTHDTPMTMTMLAGDKMNSDVFKGFIWDIEAPWRSNNSFDTYGFRKFEAENDKLDNEKYQVGKKLTKISLAIMYNLPGIPCVFQGTEIAETGYKDPFCRKPYNWKNNEEDMKQFVSKLGEYRKNNREILSTGKVNLLKADNQLLIFEREIENGNKIIFVANRTPDDVYVQIDDDDLAENQKNLWIGNYGFSIIMCK